MNEGGDERFHRTFEEPVIHGRSFRSVEDVREAVARSLDDYEAHRRPEKLDFKAPLEARQNHVLCDAA